MTTLTPTTAAPARPVLREPLNQSIHMGYSRPLASLFSRAIITSKALCQPACGWVINALNEADISSNASIVTSERPLLSIAARFGSSRKSICASNPSRSWWCAIKALIITCIDCIYPKSMSICCCSCDFAISYLFQSVRASILARRVPE